MCIYLHTLKLSKFIVEFFFLSARDFTTRESSICTKLPL